MTPAKSDATPSPRAFPSDAYVGLAESYARYRVDFPGALIRDLIGRSGVSGAGRLLDLACGTGRSTLPLAPFFQEVWAVDNEAEMTVVGEREARKRGLGHIRWIVARAEDFRAPIGSCDLVTIADAFHRLDQRAVLALVRRWLKPGAFLANLQTCPIGDHKAQWQAVVAGVVRRWMKAEPGRAEAAGPAAKAGAEHELAMMSAAGFVGTARHSFSELHRWTFESILGRLHSTSYCSPRALGGRADAFAADLKAALESFDAGGIYPEVMRFCYTIGRNPV